MNATGTNQATEQLGTMAGDGQLLQSEVAMSVNNQTAGNQEPNSQAADGQAMEPAPGLNISINELAAGALTKAVDSAAAISQFAVGSVTGVGTITLWSVNGWFATSTNAINAQFSSLVNRVFGVKR